MKKIDMLTEEFKTKYESFFIGCDAVEESGLWDREAHGEMEAFYQNDLVSVILRLIAVDGTISEREAEYLNKNFGFDYTADDLTEIYKSCEEEINRSFDEQFENGVTYLRSVNEKMADAYKELLGLICDIIIESDDVISPEEIEEAKRLKDLF